MVDWELKKDLPLLLKKYGPALAILVVGLVILLLPEKQEPVLEEPVTTQAAQSLEQELESVLSAVAGAGKDRVLLTVSVGP